MRDMRELEHWATWREIHAQPEIWAVWANSSELASAKAWCAAQDVDEVWFCGAGTSAFIGDIVVAGLEGRTTRRMRAVPTTDIVSRPRAYLEGRRPLVVNFGRSGNSTETLGTLDALDAVAQDAPRLNITCNGESALATRASKGPCHTLVLPDRTHDEGFAMTSSFSTMLLSALALFSNNDASAKLPELAATLDDMLPKLARAAGAMPVAERIVFVGAGALTFAAREAALKVMELTAGQVPALWDSTLGFRHGPKSFVTGDTRLVVFRSSDAHASLYDDDLIAELREQFPDVALNTIGPACDIEVPRRDDVWSAALYVAFAQVLGVIWSARLGLDVDNPFDGQGTLTRVVSGVRLYEVPR